MLRESSKYQFTDGKYSSKVIGKGVQQVYVEYEEEKIHVYPLKKAGHQYLIDRSNYKPLSFGRSEINSINVRPSFRQTSFDIDFLTIPFKYRFPAKGFPRQFNTNLNGGVYLGYRSDIYVLHYATNPLGISSRNTTHVGFSFGGFTGLGGTAMNPWVTNDQIAIEYDGVVWTKGVAGIIGLNNFSTGLAVGWDHLLDRNKKFWIYQGKPWVGFVFGLNLN
jgi:hypothetical protein